MKIKLAIGLFLFFSISCIYGQERGDEKYRFSKEVFKTEYKKDFYKRYNGNIEAINENTLKFGKKILIVSTDNKQNRQIFEKGIFNPDIVFGKTTTIPLNKEQIDTFSTSEKIFYNLARNDSLNICCVEELTKLNPNYQTKRYIFWLFQMGKANPTEYYFEIYNKKAKKISSFEEFIENAVMTFYYKGTLIL